MSKYNLEVYANHKGEPLEVTFRDIEGELPRKGDVYKLNQLHSSRVSLWGYYDVSNVLHVANSNNPDTVIPENPIVTINHQRDSI